MKMKIKSLNLDLFSQENLWRDGLFLLQEAGSETSSKAPDGEGVSKKEIPDTKEGRKIQQEKNKEMEELEWGTKMKELRLRQEIDLDKFVSSKEEEGTSEEKIRGIVVKTARMAFSSFLLEPEPGKKNYFHMNKEKRHSIRVDARSFIDEILIGREKQIAQSIRRSRGQISPMQLREQIKREFDFQLAEVELSFFLKDHLGDKLPKTRGEQAKMVDEFLGAMKSNPRLRKKLLESFSKSDLEEMEKMAEDFERFTGDIVPDMSFSSVVDVMSDVGKYTRPTEMTLGRLTVAGAGLLIGVPALVFNTARVLTRTFGHLFSSSIVKPKEYYNLGKDLLGDFKSTPAILGAGSLAMAYFTLTDSGRKNWVKLSDGAISAAGTVGEQAWYHSPKKMRKSLAKAADITGGRLAVVGEKIVGFYGKARGVGNKTYSAVAGYVGNKAHDVSVYKHKLELQLESISLLRGEIGGTTRYVNLQTLSREVTKKLAANERVTKEDLKRYGWGTEDKGSPMENLSKDKNGEDCVGKDLEHHFRAFLLPI
ncbi:MAG TPA: hypothetical protein ENI70_01625, partial [Candidatus Peregrinibacteria bacterium]|nr:hypothetical protein [Candidatus Peregrinibacteria bacterium]